MTYDMKYIRVDDHCVKILCLYSFKDREENVYSFDEWMTKVFLGHPGQHRVRKKPTILQEFKSNQSVNKAKEKRKIRKIQKNKIINLTEKKRETLTDINSITITMTRKKNLMGNLFFSLTVTCHLSPFTCNLSIVTCHVSPVTCQL